MPGMWRIGGHLGSAVSALVDGQLDPETTERAWEHVLACPPCRRLVEREGWVKRQLAEMAGTSAATPPADLVGSLYELDAETRDAWAAVEHLEDRARGRRRAGLAAVGVGSVSAAVLEGIFDDDVENALAALPPDFRAAVVLCDIEGLSYEEIADVLGLKLGTVRSRIHRGRTMLRKALAHRAPAVGRSRYSGPAEMPHQSRGLTARRR